METESFARLVNSVKDKFSTDIRIIECLRKEIATVEEIMKNHESALELKIDDNNLSNLVHRLVVDSEYKNYINARNYRNRLTAQVLQLEYNLKETIATNCQDEYKEYVKTLGLYDSDHNIYRNE